MTTGKGEKKIKPTKHMMEDFRLNLFGKKTTFLTAEVV